MKNKIISLLLSLLISFAFWLYVVTVVSPETEATFNNISLVLQNETYLKNDKKLMITESPATVDLTLRGSRSDLTQLNAGNITVTVNVGNLEEPGIHKVNYTVNYPGNITPSAISVSRMQPKEILVTVEEWAEKKIPVEVDYGESKVPDGFLADKENVELDVEEITISGPKSVVDQIAKALINVNLDKQSETLVGMFDYVLCDENNAPVDVKLITTNVEAVNLTLKVQRVKEIALKVNVVSGGGATEATSTIKIEPEKIQISGSDALLADLNELVLGTINLAELDKDQVLTFPITLPEGVENETGLVEAKVSVQFPNLATKTFRLTNIQPVNVPAGMRAELITKALEVTVRGPSALIAKMKETDLTVSVDFTGAKTGTATMKAQIIPSDAFKEVGPVGTYSVSATVRKG